MTTQRIREITAHPGNQIIIWIGDRNDPSQEHNYAVAVPINDAPKFLAQFQEAYARAMQNVALELAAGGCRTCGNRRYVIPEGEPVFNPRRDPCPKCIPRAEERIKKTAFGLTKPYEND